MVRKMLEGQKCLVIGSGISGIGAAAIIGENTMQTWFCMTAVIN